MFLVINKFRVAQNRVAQASVVAPHRPHRIDGTGFDISLDSRLWILVYGKKLCQKQLAYPL